MVPQWEIVFGPELDDEIEFFSNSAEAVEFVESAVLTPRDGGEGT